VAIRSLHQDILAEIFLAAFKADLLHQVVIAGQMVAVCRNWWSIGLSYSALWRYIYVYVGIESIYPPIDVLVGISNAILKIVTSYCFISYCFM